MDTNTLYSLLVGLKNGIPSNEYVSETYFIDYNKLVEQLESITESNFNEFKTEVNFKPVQIVLGADSGGVISRHTELQGERARLLIKLEALLVRFSINDQNLEVSIEGFKAN